MERYTASVTAFGGPVAEPTDTAAYDDLTDWEKWLVRLGYEEGYRQAREKQT